jgi:VCBS repeat-containing protein
MLIPHQANKTEIFFCCHLLFLLLLVSFAGGGLAQAANIPAVISGDSSASVSKLDDPDLDGMLELSGTLSVNDPDPGESYFVPSVKIGAVGRIYINSSGQWYYIADTAHVAIVGLAQGQSLIDTIQVSTVDGTQHNVNVTIFGADNPAENSNSPAIIGGVAVGGVNEDVDPDGDGFLETSGRLTITDADPGEAYFVPVLKMTTYGRLYINSLGYWFYAVDNKLTAIQNLAGADSITDTVTVRSADGTTQNVVITITGADEQGVGDITLSWVAPVEREDGSAISMAEIAGYRVYYGVSSGAYTNEVMVNGGSTMSVTLRNLSSGRYFLVVTTIDTDGRESVYSLEVARTI